MKKNREKLIKLKLNTNGTECFNLSTGGAGNILGTQELVHKYVNRVNPLSLTMFCIATLKKTLPFTKIRNIIFSSFFNMFHLKSLVMI